MTAEHPSSKPIAGLPPLEEDASWDQTSLPPSEALQRLRQQIAQAVNYQVTVGVLGKSGAGKSKLCNALLGEEEVEVFAIAAGIASPQEITLLSLQGKGISLLDMPGLGVSQQRDQAYAKCYREMLPELDLVLWLIKGDDRALGIDDMYYRDIVLPAVLERQLPVLFVVTQIDKIEPCREWDWGLKMPGPYQRMNIETKLLSLRRRFKLTPGQICAISATEGAGLNDLVDKLVQLLPGDKTWGVIHEAWLDDGAQDVWQATAGNQWTMLKTATSGLVRIGLQWIRYCFHRLVSKQRH